MTAEESSPPLTDAEADDIAARFREYELTPEQHERLEHLDDTALDRDGSAELIGDTVILNWRTMPLDQISGNWNALAEWVGWLIHRYHLSSSKIPDCWFLHGALVVPGQ